MSEEVVGNRMSRVPLYATTSLAPVPGMPWFVAETVPATLSLLSELGYSGIDLVLRTPEDARDADLTALLNENGLSLRNIVTGPARKIDGLSLCDNRTARAAISRVRCYVEYAADFGAGVVLGWMMGPLPDGDMRSAGETLLAASLRECAHIASEYGVDVLLEPINRYESNVAATAADMFRYIDAAGGGLWLMLDTFHMNIEEADPLLTAQEAAGVTRHVHLADSNRLVPGRGHFPFPEFLHRLGRGGFTGSFAVEALPVPSVLDAAHSAISTWHGWWNNPT